MKTRLLLIVLFATFSVLGGCSSVPMEMHVTETIPPTDCYPQPYW